MLTRMSKCWPPPHRGKCRFPRGNPSLPRSGRVQNHRGLSSYGPWPPLPVGCPRPAAIRSLAIQGADGRCESAKRIAETRHLRHLHAPGDLRLLLLAGDAAIEQKGNAVAADQRREQPGGRLDQGAGKTGARDRQSAKAVAVAGVGIAVRRRAANGQGLWSAQYSLESTFDTRPCFRLLSLHGANCPIRQRPNGRGKRGTSAATEDRRSCDEGHRFFSTAATCRLFRTPTSCR